MDFFVAILVKMKYSAHIVECVVREVRSVV